MLRKYIQRNMELFGADSETEDHEAEEEYRQYSRHARVGETPVNADFKFRCPLCNRVTQYSLIINENHLRCENCNEKCQLCLEFDKRYKSMMKAVLPFQNTNINIVQINELHLNITYNNSTPEETKMRDKPSQENKRTDCQEHDTEQLESEIFKEIKKIDATASYDERSKGRNGRKEAKGDSDCSARNPRRILNKESGKETQNKPVLSVQPKGITGTQRQEYIATQQQKNLPSTSSNSKDSGKRILRVNTKVNSTSTTAEDGRLEGVCVKTAKFNPKAPSDHKTLSTSENNDGLSHGIGSVSSDPKKSSGGKSEAGLNRLNLHPTRMDDNSKSKRRFDGEESSTKRIKTALNNRETEELQTQVPGYAVSKQSNNIYKVQNIKTKHHKELHGSNATNFNCTKNSTNKSGRENNKRKENDGGAAVMEDKKLRKITNKNASEATEDQQSNKIKSDLEKNKSGEKRRFQTDSGESGDKSDTIKGKNNVSDGKNKDLLGKLKEFVEKMMNKKGVPDFKAMVHYSCPICTQRFELAGHYKNHLKNCHGESEPKISEQCKRLVCPFCYEEKSPKSYNSHITLGHPDKYLKKFNTS